MSDKEEGEEEECEEEECEKEEDNGVGVKGGVKEQEEEEQGRETVYKV